MKHLFQLCFLLIIGFAFQSCNDEIKTEFKDYTDEEYALLSSVLDLPQGAYDYSPEFDQGFLSQQNVTNIDVRKSNHKATLGRVLFYDNLLSKNGTISCASCHKQELAFADDVSLSEGFEGGLTLRNSLPLGNTIGFETSYGGGSSFVVQSAQFGWDEANENLEEQSVAAITSEIEMGLHMQEALNLVKEQDYYKVLFNKAYGTELARESLMLDAIQEFVNSIVSADSKFDQAKMETRGGLFFDFDAFTTEENRGKQLYNNSCANCHSFDHQFTAVAIANNGLDMIYEDKGVGEVTGRPFDNGVFKVPFLRNIELTAPYMHDGRFETLEDVVEHYSSGIQDHENLHFNLKNNNNSSPNMNFSDQDKSDLVAYLKTLTDETLLADVRFSDPFK